MGTFVWNVKEKLGANILIKHIMIFFPDNVEHEIEDEESGGRPSNDAQLIKVSFPYDKMYPDKATMFGFDVAESHWSPNPGEYEISLPLLLPEYPPGFNVWTISMCSKGGEERCQSLRDTDPPGTKPHERLTILRFPIPGFGILDESPPRGEVDALAVVHGFAALFFSFFSRAQMRRLRSHISAAFSTGRGDVIFPVSPALFCRPGGYACGRDLRIRTASSESIFSTSFFSSATFFFSSNVFHYKSHGRLPGNNKNNVYSFERSSRCSLRFPKSCVQLHFHG